MVADTDTRPTRRSVAMASSSVEPLPGDNWTNR